MAESNGILPAGLSEAEQQALASELLRLLSLQARRYTSGESSSVRRETAEELLRSVCCCLDIANRPPEDLRRMLAGGMEREFEEGMRLAAEKARYGKRLWQQLCLNMPPAGSVFMTGTLKSIGGFFKRYNIRFFAHELPCDIDYPLSAPVPDSLLGIDYVNSYLERLYIENCFLSQFRREDLITVLELHCPGYSDLPLNLFEPAAANALGLAVLNKPVKKLRLSGADLDGLYRVFSGKDAGGVFDTLSRAAGSLPEVTGGTGAYLKAFCSRLAPRAAAAAAPGGLGGIFTAR